MSEYAELRKQMEQRKELQAKLEQTLQAMRQTLEERRAFDLKDLEKQAQQRDANNIKGRKIA